MKDKIHPQLHEVLVHCTCGNEFKTRSTKKEMRVEICAACHPFFTGEQRFIDTAGRVDKFAQRYGSIRARRAAPKVSDVAAEEASA